jgi:hypothetical protein
MIGDRRSIGAHRACLPNASAQLNKRLLLLFSPAAAAAAADVAVLLATSENPHTIITRDE